MTPEEMLLRWYFVCFLVMVLAGLAVSYTIYLVKFLIWLFKVLADLTLSDRDDENQ